MQPLVHRVAIMLAREAGFFDCHFNGIPTVNYSWCNRACLVKDEDGTLEQVLKSTPNSDQKKLQTIFSVNESFPDLRFERFAKLTCFNICGVVFKDENCQCSLFGKVEKLKSVSQCKGRLT